MSHRLKSSCLVAALLIGSALVGCGGGNAEPPPVPVDTGPPISGPDTAPPTVTISSNVSGPTATGPVTYTFVFSEDVGVSFEAADIVVSGGTLGAFTRVDGRQATLVVTPTAGVAGSISISVAAGTFSDIAGNANVAGANASTRYIASQTITFASPGNQAVGTPPPALTAAASSGLPVTITSSTGSVCTVSGTTLTLVAAGTCSLSANQAGDGSYAPAAPVTVSFAVTGGAPADLGFSSGFAGGGRTVEGGAYFSYSGSNLDGFSCSGGAAWCGSGDGGTRDQPLAQVGTRTAGRHRVQVAGKLRNQHFGIHELLRRTLDRRASTPRVSYLFEATRHSVTQEFAS